MKKIVNLVAASVLFGLATQAFARDWNAYALCQSDPNCGTCFSAGTKITLADGSKLAVEKLNPTLAVRLPNLPAVAAFNTNASKFIQVRQGTSATAIKQLLVKPASRQMVTIKDSQGHVLTVTDHHPIMTVESGAQRAGDLKAGQLILTENGNAKVVSVEKSPYKGMVYNFIAPNRSESAMAPGHMVYANGILTGDLVVQAELYNQSKK